MVLWSMPTSAGLSAAAAARLAGEQGRGEQAPTEIGVWLTFRVDAHTYVRTRLIDSTSVECLSALVPPAGEPGSAPAPEAALDDGETEGERGKKPNGERGGEPCELRSGLEERACAPVARRQRWSTAARRHARTAARRRRWSTGARRQRWHARATWRVARKARRAAVARARAWSEGLDTLSLQSSTGLYGCS
jgi:hypothetical protein